MAAGDARSSSQVMRRRNRSKGIKPCGGESRWTTNASTTQPGIAGMFPARDQSLNALAADWRAG